MCERMLCLVVVLSAVGCADLPKAEPPMPPTVDRWFRAPQNSEGFVRLDPERFAVVLDEFQPDAVLSLKETPLRPLTAEEAARLVGRSLIGGGEFVLLRGLAMDTALGGFELSVRGAEVFVHHGGLGRRPLGAVRQAVVAVLPTVPDTVYVTCCTVR